MIRNVVALLRGKATPLQVFLAGLLGGLIGFVPSFSTSGGLLVGYVLLLLVLNANVGLCLLVAAGAKVLSLLAMPLSFSLGRVLLEGPASGLFETLINAPVFAWFGLEYYATSGGLVLGAVVGLVAGGLMAKSLAGFREKMKRVEQKHEKFSTVSSRWWSRLFLWCLLGKGHGKATYGDLVEKGRGKPLRFAGVIVAAVFAAVLFLAPNLMSGPYLAGVAKGGLESWNGATVDIDELNLDLAGGKLSLSGLALADPNDLSADLFRATQLEADIGTDDLLRKKLTIDRLVIVDGATGAARSSPGVLTAPVPEPAPHAKKGNGGLKEAGKNLDEYLANAKEWKDRLAQVQEWLDTLSPDDGGDGGDGGAVKGESLRDRLEREVAAKGYAGVSADHLVHESPSLLIRELVAGGVRCDQLDGEPLDIRIENISTQPSLVLEPARLTVVAQDGTLDVDIGLGGAAANPAANRLKFVLKGVPAESLSGSLEVDGKPVLSDGTIDVSLDGHWAGGEVGQLDLPLDVTLHGVTVRTPMGGRAFEKLTLPFGLRGPMDNPQVSFDGDALHEAIMAGAAAQLDAAVDAKTAEARGALEDKANEHLKDAQSQLGDGIGDALGGLFGGDDDKDDKDEKKKKKKKKKSKKAADDTMEDD
ncbi:MAG: hypothetical protein P8N09_04900 [Planctomycetota bacterium]|nr:hypothetical protein [Planctomycetota bacterium]